MVGHLQKEIRLPILNCSRIKKLEDFKPFAKYGALAGLEFQRVLSKKRGILQEKHKSTCSTHD
jgi:hypothetical protein